MTKKITQAENDLLIKLNDLTNDLQRTRADFENYRKHVDEDLSRAEAKTARRTVAKFLPLIDILDMAVANVPADLSENSWIQGIVGAQKKLQKLLDELKLQKIPAKIGDDFNHETMNAIAVEESDGEREIVVEILQDGYLYDGQILRPAMVKVGRK